MLAPSNKKGCLLASQVYQYVNILAAAEGASNQVDIHHPFWLWPATIAFIALLILVDLRRHNDDKEESTRSHLIQTGVWIAISLAFGLVLLPFIGGEGVGLYYSGYIIEKSLSIDNVFVWSIILSYFNIPDRYQHRVLFWGIFGALVFRAIFIFLGIQLIERFQPILIVLGLFLLLTGYKTWKSDDDEFDPQNSKAIKLIMKRVPISSELHGHALFTRENGKRCATMLFVALCAIEITDIVFAVDSVPAILAIASDPYIVFTSNALAILGLRALYFCFDDMKDKFTLLNKGLGLILVLVGIKMIVGPHEIFGYDWIGYHPNILLSLGVIIAILVGSVLLSIRKNKLEPQAETKDPDLTPEPAT